MSRTPQPGQLTFAWDAAPLAHPVAAPRTVHVEPPSAPVSVARAPLVSAPAEAARATLERPVERPVEEVARSTGPVAPALCEKTARESIERAMAKALGVRVEIEVTKNRRTMISTRRLEGAVRVRLHHMFLEADLPVVDALGRYVKTGDRRASRRLGDFIESRRERYISQRPRRTLRTFGHHHDLASIFTVIADAFFPGGVEGVAITWGKNGGGRRGRRRKRSIRLGTYTHDERLVRVHPVLDQPWVPRFFVEYIVFHELLHHVEPAREAGGRTIFHTTEFRRRERAYPGYDRAIEWERANLDKLLTP